MMKDLYCIADDLKLYLQESGDWNVHNMFFSGWKHEKYVSNLFVFAANGVFIACSINAPGAIHHFTVAEWGGVYRKLQKFDDEVSGQCVVESAFFKTNYSFFKTNYSFLVKSSQDCVVRSNGAHE